MINLGDYTVGWICAVGAEVVAATSFLDDEHGPLDYTPDNDNNTYILGRIGKHNVVIAAMPHRQYGLVNAAVVAKDMVRSFPGVRIGLMVGIGGGAPSLKHDIRLGDIVVSSPSSNTGGVLQYDYGKTIQDKELLVKGHLNQPPHFMLTALAVLGSEYERKGHNIEKAINAILRENPRLQDNYGRPEPSTDRLYKSNYTHKGGEEASCVKTCSSNECDLISRRDSPRGRDNPTIHHGLIASANQLMKDALVRDTLSRERDVLCFEMEAAGLMNHFPCIVIRGICDYSDTHKNDAWQGYAAMVAAAYAKDLLSKIAPNKVEAERKLVDVLLNVNLKIDDIWSMAISTKVTGQMKKIGDWLSAPDFSTNLKDALQRRHPGSGSWFLSSRKFRTWRTRKNSFLWLSGISGSGKTVLSSSVIEELGNYSQKPLYFYFDFFDPRKQSLENAIRGLILQLYYKESNVQHSLESLYASYISDTAKSLSIEVLLDIFRVMIQQAGEQWIIIDALDECGTYDELNERVLPWIKSLRENQLHLHLLVTSCPEHDIKATLEKWAHAGDIVNLGPALMQKDINLYIQNRLETGRLGERWALQPEVQDEIKKALIQKAGGMFRLVACQFDELESCINRPMVRQSLKLLPSTINGTYARILRKVPDNLFHLTILILQFLVYSAGPLTIDQLVDAVTIETTRRDLFDPNDRMPIPTEITRFCPNLVVTTTMTGLDMRRFYGNDYALEYDDNEEVAVVKLAHPSVKHYLTSTELERDNIESFLETNARTAIAKICITHLLQLRKQGNIQLSYSQLVRTYPLAKYAARYWASHAKVAESGSTMITNLIVKFLSCEEAFSLCTCIYPLCDLRRDITCHPDKLNFAVQHGLLLTAKRLINDGADVNAIDSWGGKYLHTNHALGSAVVGDHYEMVKLLLDNGAICDTEDQSALAAAASLGNYNMTRLLLDRSADRNSHDKNNCVALRAAAKIGCEEIVRALLESGADANFVCKGHGTALEAAVLNDQENILKLLIAHGADTNAVDGETNLHFALQRGNVDMANILIQCGANLNARNTLGITPLHLAIRHNFKNVAKLLIDRGADVNAENCEGTTPLLLAVRQGSEDMAGRLIDHGANINKEDDEGRSLLHIAVIRAYENMSRLLVDHGATINSKNSQGKTPLQLAISVDFNLEINQLINFGADVNMANLRGETPLQMAVENGREEVARVLREKGAGNEIHRAKRRKFG
ncbi:hypothetical protein F4805DRAFT_475208 [Annulohypoxylon moriforme]|nr:hypothetical protein F4805DRAFT_475208 [Annulohypoxylon moriforme]